MIREIENEEKVQSRNERQRIRREARQEEQKAVEQQQAEHNGKASTVDARATESQDRPNFM